MSANHEYLPCAPCGCPLAEYERTDGTSAPITVPAIDQGGILGVIPAAVWCAYGHGWVKLPHGGNP